MGRRHMSPGRSGLHELAEPAGWAATASVLVRPDDLFARARAEGPVDIEADAVLDGPNRAVGEEELRHAVVPAGGVPVVHVRARRRVLGLEQRRVPMVVV